MLLGSSMFADPDVNIYTFDRDAWWNAQTDEVIFDASDEDDYRHWVISPIRAPILSAAALGVERLDGCFLIRGVVISPSCEGIGPECFIGVTMPERIVDYTFVHLDGKIIEHTGPWSYGRAVPSIAIDKSGNYDLYHVRGCADYGVSVLRRGLEISGNSWPIVSDLAYILRDEGRHQEAVDAFSLLIEKEPDYLLEYAYHERERLYGALGQLEAQERDKEMVESLRRPPHPRRLPKQPKSQ
jgi:hypothetical protein